MACMQLYIYESPEIQILEINTEGILCGSNEIVDENEGYWE